VGILAWETEQTGFVQRSLPTGGKHGCKEEGEGEEGDQEEEQGEEEVVTPFGRRSELQHDR
jgi:hypothetical protein